MKLENVARLVRNSFQHRFGRCTLCGKTTIFLSFSGLSAQHAREQFHCVFCKSVSRQRHVALEILRAFKRKEISIQDALPFLKTLKIYSASSGDPLSRVLSQNNPNYVVSEYFPDVPIGEEKKRGAVSKLRITDIQKQ